MTRLGITLLIVPIITLGLMGKAMAFDECLSDADCVTGFHCEELEISNCSDFDCPSGEECPDSPCEIEIEQVCVPGPCSTDADCGEGLSCFALVYDECDAPAVPECEPGGECDDSDGDEGCEEITESYCLPSYVGPCSTDTDCGVGFSCVAEEICECSGDAGGGDDGDDEPDCSCSSSGEHFCEPIEVECESDDSCPEGWTCEDGPSSITCTYDPETGEEVCGDPETETGFCMPPYWDFGWYDESDSEGGSIGFDRTTGAENARLADDRDFPASSSGCQAAPGTTDNALAFAWLLPLLIVLGRRRAH